MNKSTLYAVAAILVTPLYAQDNLVQNGDFEDTGYTPFIYEDNVKRCPDLVAGWDRQSGEFKAKDFNNTGLDKYYVRGEIITDDLAGDGGQQCMRIQRYEWSGSEKGYPQGVDGGIQQTIEVAPNTTYNFSFLYRLSDRLSNNTAVPAFWAIYEGDETATEDQNTRRKLYNELDNKWYSTKKSFTTKATTTRVRIYLGVQGGYVYSWGGNLGMFADYDNVSLVEDIQVSINELGADKKDNLLAWAEGNTVELNGIDAEALVKVYDVAGSEVLSLNPKSEFLTFTLYNEGVYLIWNGVRRKPVKVVVR